MNCEPKKISELLKTSTLHPEDLIPLVQCGVNKVINAKDLIDQIIALAQESGDQNALCLALQAKNLAMKASADAEQALKDICKAIVLAQKALDAVCSLTSRVNELERTIDRLQRELNELKKIVEYIRNRSYEVVKTVNETNHTTTYTLRFKDEDTEWTNVDVPIEIINYYGDGDNDGNGFIKVVNGKITFDSTKLPKYTGDGNFINVNDSTKEISFNGYSGDDFITVDNSQNKKISFEGYEGDGNYIQIVGKTIKFTKTIPEVPDQITYTAKFPLEIVDDEETGGKVIRLQKAEDGQILQYSTSNGWQFVTPSSGGEPAPPQLWKIDTYNNGSTNETCLVPNYVLDNVTVNMPVRAGKIYSDEGSQS